MSEPTTGRDGSDPLLGPVADEPPLDDHVLDDPLLDPATSTSEPTPTGDDRPDDVVLDELSRAFGGDGPGDGGPAMSAADPGGVPSRATIAIGGDDDFVDPVYLDDELAKDDSSGTVFIDDDGTGDAIAPKEATSPGIEPRLRQRRIGVRRAAGLRRLKWVAIVTAVLVVLIGGLAVLGSSLFAVDEVAISGNVYTDEAVLQEVVEDLEGTPVLLVDTDDAERRLEAIPWVEDARVRTDFPDRVTIEIRERAPVATMRGIDGLFRVLDPDGRVLDVIEGQPVAVVLIAGPGTLDVPAGEFAPVGPSSASSLVLKLTPSVRSRTEGILVTDDGADLRLFLSREDAAPVEVRFGSAVGDSDQIEKLVRLESRLEDLDDPSVTVIDVSTAEVTVL